MDASLFLLPSEATQVIVQYRPRYSISCVLPPTKRTITCAAARYDRTDFKPFEIETPTLLMNHGFSLNRASAQPGNHQFGIYALNTDETDKLQVKPFRLANVNEHGIICFGNLQAPMHLRAANNVYWNAAFTEEGWDEDAHAENCDKIEHENYYHEKDPHECEKENVAHKCKCAVITHEHNCKKARANCACCNKQCACEKDHKINCPCGRLTCKCKCDCKCCLKKCDCKCTCECCEENCYCSCLCDETKIFKEHLKNYHPEKIDSIKWEDYTKSVCGDKFIAISKPAHGVLISYNNDILPDLPRRILNKSTKESVLIAFVLKEVDGWKVWTGQHESNLSETEAKLLVVNRLTHRQTV